MSGLLALILVGISVGLGNFAASVAIGLGGVTRSVRLRIALVFGVFETGMPIVGLLIGQQVVHKLGNRASLIGGILLGLTGAYLVISSLRKTDDKKVVEAENGWGKLIIAGLSLSIDNLIIGFGLGARHQSLLLTIIVIGSICITLSLLGLELGGRLNSKVEEYSELFSGLILMLVGLLIGLKIL